ncbi:MAG: hypothetical protein JSU96_17305 [Acidobacteriota bacterium]|nr:MAG: hypothetical protein JSU96_17305 [Acidobacteriota bacterium]
MFRPERLLQLSLVMFFGFSLLSFSACSGEVSTEPEQRSAGEGAEEEEGSDEQGLEEEGGPLVAPFDLMEHFELSLWGEADRISVDPNFSGRPREADSNGTCLKIIYEPGEKAWGAIYWQPKRTLGVRETVEVQEAKKISFWARGETGEEVVGFRKTGSPAVELLKEGEAVTLTSEWKHYELLLDESSLGQVAGVFGVRWESLQPDDAGLTIYLDEIRYE